MEWGYLIVEDKTQN